MIDIDDNSSPLCSSPLRTLSPLDVDECIDKCIYFFDQNLPVPSDKDDLLKKIELLMASVEDQKQSNERMMTSLSEQKESIKSNDTILQLLLQSNIIIMESLQKQEQNIESCMRMFQLLLQSNNPTVQQQAGLISTINASGLPFVVNEISTNRSDQELYENLESTAITTNNGMSETRSILECIQNEPIMENNEHNEIRTHVLRATTNELIFNDQSSVKRDEIDKIRYEKNQKKTVTGEDCHEVIFEISEEASGSVTNTDYAISKVTKNVTVINENQPRKKIKTKDNQYKPPSTSVDHQLSHQLATTNENSFITDEPVEVCLLHPVKDKFDDMTKTGRGILVVDDFDNPLELIVCRGHLPIGYVVINLNIVSQSCYKDHLSFYKLSRERYGKYSDTLSDRFEIIDENPQRIKLGSFYVAKCLNNVIGEDDGTQRKETEEKPYTLKFYPSGKEDETTGMTVKDVLDKYQLRATRAAISFPNVNAVIFWSNQLSRDKKAHVTNDLKVKIVIIQNINPPVNDQYGITCQINIPERFHCTLGTGYQWLKISLTDGFYIIENNERKEFCYVNFKEGSFSIYFEIVKRYEGLIGLNHFSVKIQLLHSEGPPISSSTTYYPGCKPWQSEKISI